jgi:hypothetical protein
MADPLAIRHSALPILSISHFIRFGMLVCCTGSNTTTLKEKELDKKKEGTSVHFLTPIIHPSSHTFNFTFFFQIRLKIN